MASKSGSLGSASKQTAFDIGFEIDIGVQSHKKGGAQMQICSNRIQNRGKSALTALDSFAKMQASWVSLSVILKPQKRSAVHILKSS